MGIVGGQKSQEGYFALSLRHKYALPTGKDVGLLTQ